MDFLKPPTARMSNCSYMFARDPSILSFNRPGLPPICTNVGNELAEIEKEQEEENLAVYLRIKSGYDFKDIYEVSNNVLHCFVPPGSMTARNCKDGVALKKSFTFSRIFNDSSQLEIFNEIVKPKLLSFINGVNSTFLTYGVSGSGKTFTISGTAQDPGVIPRSLEYLFRTLPPVAESPLVRPQPHDNVVEMDRSMLKADTDFAKNILNSMQVDKSLHFKTYQAMQQRLSTENVGIIDDVDNVEVSIWVSFAEIYNEQIFDLLQPEPQQNKKRTRLQLGSYNGNTYIKNLSSVHVKSGEEAYQVLQYGLHHLQYASTKLNMHSSRSHSIFTIKLIQVNRRDGGVYMNKLNFCDLAGSERLKKTMNVGERLKESNNINSSLLVLSRCIHDVRNVQKNGDKKVIPFRESKLTQLFQKALCGDENISMIVTINPSKEQFDETQQVLNFAAIAREIQHKIDLVKPATKGRFSQLIEKSHLTNIDECTEIEEKQEEINKLYRVIDLYQSSLEQKQNEYEEKVQKTKEFLKKNFEEREKIIEKSYEFKLERYKQEILKLRGEMKKLLSNRKNETIINLDSDSEGETDSKVVEELVNLKTQYYSVLEELNNARKEIDIKKETINEAVAEYKELRMRYQMIEEENLLLKERIFELENDIAIYRRDMVANDITPDDTESDEKCDI